MGIRDPKNNDGWATGEAVTSAQLGKILENQRVFMMDRFINCKPTSAMGISASGNRAQDIVLSYNDKQAVYFGAGDFDENDIVTCTDLEDSSWTGAAPGLTAAASIHPTKGAAKPNHTDHLVYFGVDRDAATSEGYIKNSAGTWSIVNRAATGTAQDEVIGMWYWPEMDTFIASWRYVSNAHRFETNTAEAGWVDRATGLTGDFEVHKADMSPTHFVAVGLSPSGTATTEIAVSTNGTTFTAVDVPVSKEWRLVAYDRTDQIWYLLASDWTLYTATDPSVGSNWGHETTFVAPTNASLRSTGSFQPDLVVQGGVIAIGGAQLESADADTVLLVTRDFGANWVMASPESTPATILPVLKVLDGRLVYLAGYGTNDDVPYVGPRGLEPMIVIE